MARLLVLVAMTLAASGCKSQVAGGSADGDRIYAEACATCHGAEGVPPEPMRLRLGVRDLTDPGLHERLSDDEMRHQIVHGSDNRRMPGFAGALSDEQIDAVVRAVRALRAD